jgi:hypothetical protein
MARPPKTSELGASAPAITQQRLSSEKCGRALWVDDVNSGSVEE